jgi:hypothetical protein
LTWFFLLADIKRRIKTRTVRSYEMGGTTSGVSYICGNLAATRNAYLEALDLLVARGCSQSFVTQVRSCASNVGTSLEYLRDLQKLDHSCFADNVILQEYHSNKELFYETANCLDFTHYELLKDLSIEYQSPENDETRNIVCNGLLCYKKGNKYCVICYNVFRDSEGYFAAEHPDIYKLLNVTFTSIPAELRTFLW